MDIDHMIATGQLGPDFPLPTAAPFTFTTALEAGVRRHDLSRLCTEGLLRRPIKRVYVATALGDSLALRTACLKLVVPEDCVVVDRHAGWLLGHRWFSRPANT